jgi:hypothetical protein
MTSEPTPTTRETTTRAKASHNGGETPVIAKGDIQAAVHEVRGALEDVGRQVPTVARASQKAANDLFKAIETGTDGRVSAGVTLSLGFAIGLLVGGGPRILVLAALAPVAAMGMTIADRRARPGRTTAA